MAAVTTTTLAPPKIETYLVDLELAKGKLADFWELTKGKAATPEDQTTLTQLQTSVRRRQADLQRAVDSGNEAYLARQMQQFATGVLSGVAPDAFTQAVLKSPFGEFLASHRGQLHKSGAAWATPPLDLVGFGGGDPNIVAAVITTELPGGGSLAVPQVIPGIVSKPTRRLVVADLLGSGTASSNAIVFMRESALVNAAAPVAEAGIKPESTITFEAVSEPVRKVATFIPVSDEVLEDVPGFTNYIQTRLQHFVLLAEDAQLLAGDGTGANFLGLLNRPGLAPSIARVDPENSADAILKQVAQIETTTGETVSGIVLNPANYTTLQLAKDTTGRYLCGGFCTGAATPTLWGYSVVTTPAMPVGTALVGALRTAVEFRVRTPVRIVASNSHQDFFIKNLVAILAEQRGALVVYQPAALGLVTNLS